MSHKSAYNNYVESLSMMQKGLSDLSNNFVKLANGCMGIWSPSQAAQEAIKRINNNNVDHPSYYAGNKIEVINFIEDHELDFCLGNSVKYICRAGKKNPNAEIEDLEKAKWYLQRKIDKLRGSD